ncbi:methyltransferase-like protein [Biscogniauxia marginata]|nr:methyltransferase-like protein [Biscogniauxia marginata]
MSSFDQLKKEYDDQANAYEDYLAKIPLGILETQLFKSALGTCTGATILDLGGGTGIRARQAIEAGAVAVDVVDISPQMLQVGRDVEASLRREDVIHWYLGDVSKPLDGVPLRETAYDIVMANWVLDHAATAAVLKGMWRNIAGYLKLGGRFLGMRSGDPRAPAMTDGRARYGMSYKDHKDVPDGVHFRYVVHLDPPIEFEASSMRTSYSGSTEMHEKFGLRDVEVEPYENTEVFRQDPEFWKVFLDNPSMVVVKARKNVS